MLVPGLISVRSRLPPKKTVSISLNGTPKRRPQEQPGSWAYAILPFLEQHNMFHKRAWTEAVAIYVCPSRRRQQANEPQNDKFGEYFGGGWKWAPIDYGANAHVIPNRPQVVGIGEIRDGTSNTILLGEKAVHPEVAASGSWYWDEPFFLGGSGGTQRGFAGPQAGDGYRIIRDSYQMGLSFRYNWGSSHAAGAHFLFADGSVQLLPHGIPFTVVRALLTPSGGEPTPEF